MKVLLAVDGSEFGEAATQEVAARIWPKGTIIKVFSVVELPFVPTEVWAIPENYYSQLEAIGREKAQAAINKSVQTLRTQSGVLPEIITDIKTGHAATTILDEAEEWGAELIVLGSHGYHGFKRFLLGSVSQAIATHAKCSVVIVRRHQAAESR